jgi:hypothetical protein
MPLGHLLLSFFQGEALTPEGFVTIAAFAVTVGSFAASLMGITKSKWIIAVLLTAFVACAVTSVMLIWQRDQHVRHVEAVSRKTASAIGSGQKTADEILLELYPEDYGMVSEGLGLLLKADTVGNKVVEMTDKAGLRHNVRVYFVKQ